MRRPLFWAALCLVLVIAVRLETGKIPDVSQGQISLQSLTASEELIIAGQVYQKDGSQIYLQNVSICRSLSQEYLTDQVLLSQAGDSRQSISCKENIICKVTDAESIPLGGKVVVEGVFTHFSRATNPGEFDAFIYYRTLGIGGRLDRATILAQGEKYWRMRESLYDLRAFLRERLYRALGEREAGVMCALLLGDKEGLEEQVEELYRRNGILHILSISSLHVTILGMTLYGLLRRLGVPVGLAAVVGSIILLLYGGLTGFGVSACRAIGMYLIRMLGEILGRTYDMLTALGVMAAIMVAVNPYYLQHSGFLLSYSSVLGIGVLYPALFGKLGKNTDKTVGKFDGKAAGKCVMLAQGLWKGIRQSAAASLSVTLSTLPVQLWCYYEVPVYAVFLNLLVLPFVKALMISGIILSALPGFLPAAAVAKLILGWYELLCGWFGRLPFHTWNPGCPRLWQIAVYYLVLVSAVSLRGWLSGRQERAKKGLMIHAAGNRGSGEIKSTPEDKQDVRGNLFRSTIARLKLETLIMPILVVCAVLLLGSRPYKENIVAFLDVGQGDCVLVQTASGENYLFDCGSSNRKNIGEYVLLPYLKYNGIRTLDAVFVSHPDTDHMSGILELLGMGEESGVEVCQLVLPDLAETIKEEQMGELLAVAEKEGDTSPTIRYISAGDMWESRCVRFTCLHPAAGCDWEEANTYSECFYVEFYAEGMKETGEENAVTLLLTGDVEGLGENALIEALADCDIRQVDVLKVAHHGSRGATSEAFLEQIAPSVAVISCGRGNSYGHPHRELLERLTQVGSRIIQTQEQGAVVMRFPR